MQRLGRHGPIGKKHCTNEGVHQLPVRQVKMVGKLVASHKSRIRRDRGDVPPGKQQLKLAWGAQGQQQLPPPPPVPNPDWASQRPPRGGRHPEWANQRRPDNRYMYTEDGTELCYTFNRAADGCGAECTAQPPRAHACEWCRGQHRAIRCPSHPNWVPPPKMGKGKGKTKGT